VTRRIELPEALRDAIVAAARAAYPAECCGLLEGVQDGALWRITALHATTNLSSDNRAFEIDPADHIAAQKAARGNGHAIIGCYHSHPNGMAQPSQFDLAGAMQDDFLWLIAAGETLNGFVYLRGVFTGADWVTSSG
jgi:proteasome lid subunit RPN8/RPN11